MTGSVNYHAKHFYIRDPDFNDPELIYQVYDEMRDSGGLAYSDQPTQIPELTQYAEGHWEAVSSKPSDVLALSALPPCPGESERCVAGPARERIPYGNGNAADCSGICIRSGEDVRTGGGQPVVASFDNHFKPSGCCEKASQKEGVNIGITVERSSSFVS